MELLNRWWLLAKANAGVYAGRLALAVVIVIASVLVARVATAAVHRMLRGRAESLAPALRGLIRLCAIGAGVVMALDQVGINIATVLAGAGVVGLAVGFGAQTLVKDVISGFFLILDEVVRVGDSVKVGDATGVVESIGLRAMQVRGFDGQVWSIPNGSVTVVCNMSREWARATVQVGLPADGDVRAAMELLQKVGDAYQDANKAVCLDKPEAQGVISGPADVGIRLIAKVKTGEQGKAERDLRLAAKEAFDAAGIKAKF